MERLVVIRVRGEVNVRHDVEKTLDLMRLFKRNNCIVLPNNPEMLGMIRKAKDYITWGILDDETFKLLVEKRGEPYLDRLTDKKEKVSYKRNYLEIDGKKIKKVFRLDSPRKGYGRTGIKKTFVKSGALGNRGAKINLLIKRMI